MSHRNTERAYSNKFQVLLAIALIDFIKPSLFVVLTTKYLDDPVAAHDFLGDLCHLAHRVLDAIAVAAKSNTQDANHRGDDRKQDNHENRQLRTLQNHYAERSNHGQHIANRYGYDAGNRLCNHLDVVGHAREQRPRGSAVEKPGRQRQKFAEHIPPQRADDATPYPTE